jgi:hypothetical protein
MNLLVEMVVDVLQICHAAHVRVFQKGHQLLAVVVEGPGKRNLEIKLQKIRQKINQCLGSVTFWCGSGSESPDPHLLMDPDPTADPTPFFIDFKDAKKKFARRHNISSLKNLIFY